MNPLPLLALLAAGPAADPVRFVANSSSAEPLSGRLESFPSAGQVKLTDPNAELAAGTLVSLRAADRAMPAWPRQPQIILANGDRVAGTVAGGQGARVLFAPQVGGSGEPWAVPLSAIAALWLVPPPGDVPPDPARYPWRVAVRRGDVILLANGDTVSGTVETVAADGKSLQLAGERGQPLRTVDLTTAAAVVFDPALARVRKPKGTYCRVVTRSGSRISAADLTSDGTTFTGTTLFGAKLQLAVSEMIAVDVLQGKAVYLSDLKPKRAVADGYGPTDWPWTPDRSVKGYPLRLAGPTGGWFDDGLGTHPKTTLTYDLGGKYRRFEARVGLDPVTGRRGSAAVRVLVDGKEIPLGGLNPLTSATPPVELRTDVSGAKELTLVVDFGPAGDVQADVNWVDARLVE